MSDKIVNLPGKYQRKKLIDSKKGTIRCEVTERWIQFPKASDKYHYMDYLPLDVMTMGANEKERKICEIIVDRDMLQKMLKALPTNDHT